jgi:hypothetical protein
MLSTTIYDEIFNLKYKTGDMAIEFIIDEFCSHDLHVYNIEDNDLAVTFHAKNKHCRIELRIDRLNKVFDIVAQKDGWTIFPTRGDWNIIEAFLDKLTSKKGTTKIPDTEYLL